MKNIFWMLISFFLCLTLYAANTSIESKISSKDKITSENKTTGEENVLFGIDVSHYQGEINWPQVDQQNLHFVFIKASQGRHTIDTQYHRNWKESKNTSLLRGVYHYLDPALDALDQAAHFIALTGGDFGDFPPIVDIEAFEKQTAKEVAQVLTVFLSAIEKQFSCKPIIYTSPNFWSQLKQHDFGHYKLWLADYAKQANTPKGWNTWTFWQFENDATILGINVAVDKNQFKGGIETLKALSC